jgi:hypothetical protein
MLFSNLAIRSNTALRLLFGLCARGLPRAAADQTGRGLECAGS